MEKKVAATHASHLQIEYNGIVLLCSIFDNLIQ